MAAVRCRLLLSLLAFAALASAPAADACPFCTEERGPTLVDDFKQAPLVVLGTFTNYKPNPGDIGGGTSDLVVEKILKQHAFAKGKKVITLGRGVPATKSKFVVFIDIFEGKPDPYRGVEVTPESDLVKYLTKALELKDRPNSERLRHCFDYLSSADADVSLDAYREFAKADYADYKAMAKRLPADKVAAMLTDPKTPSYRVGLYASLLGHCGDPAKHGKLLREQCDDPEKRRGSGIDGLLASYVMLQPAEGWKYVAGILNDPKQDFLMRYAGLRTARFLWGERTDLVKKEELVKGVVKMLEHADMADFAIEDLRKWQRWELCDPILGLFERESHNVPVIRRAILRYALQCERPAATAFVKGQRQRDAEWVADAEELLRLEAEARPETPPPAKK